jgi:hypothetical protein
MAPSGLHGLRFQASIRYLAWDWPTLCVCETERERERERERETERGREGGRKGGRGELSEAPRGRDFRTHSRWGLPSSLAAAFLSGTVKEAGCGHHPHFPRGPSFCLAFQLGPVIFRRKHLKMLQVYLLFSFNLFLLPVAHASS